MENAAVASLDDPKLEERLQGIVREVEGHFYVIVKSGHVFLSGEAKSLDFKNRVEALVWDVNGVRSVTNHIRVDDMDDESYRLLENRVLNCPFKGVDLLLS